MAFKKGTEIATIDVALVTIEASIEGVTSEIGITTSNKIGVTPEIETKDAVKLIIKSRLISQKPSESTLTGNTIVLTDNVFTPELALIFQGGEIEYDDIEPSKIVGYTPPVVGSAKTIKPFTLCAYSVQYSASGQITQYEKISYPNCMAVPVAFSSEDGVFRVTEYTIHSAPNTGEAPYVITYVPTLPAIL